MGTLNDRTYTSTFEGLKSTAITSGTYLVVGFTLHEVLSRLRRYPEEDKRRKNGEQVPDRGVEGYVMGYLFRARSYVPFNPSVSWILFACDYMRLFTIPQLVPIGPATT